MGNIQAYPFTSPLKCARDTGVKSEEHCPKGHIITGMGFAEGSNRLRGMNYIDCTNMKYIDNPRGSVDGKPNTIRKELNWGDTTYPPTDRICRNGYAISGIAPYLGSRNISGIELGCSKFEYKEPGIREARDVEWLPIVSSDSGDRTSWVAMNNGFVDGVKVQAHHETDRTRNMFCIKAHGDDYEPYLKTLKDKDRQIDCCSQESPDLLKCGLFKKPHVNDSKPSVCDSVMKEYCDKEDNKDKPICRCYHSHLAKEFNRPAICLDVICQNDGYIPRTQRDITCPSVIDCRQYINLSDSEQVMIDANLTQYCGTKPDDIDNGPDDPDIPDISDDPKKTDELDLLEKIDNYKLYIFGIIGLIVLVLIIILIYKKMKK
jgi:hypothetical protein